jgi:hypothetical protein
MSIADRTWIIRAGLGVAVKAGVAIGPAACGFSPAGGGGDDAAPTTDAAGDDGGVPTSDASDRGLFCDRDDPDLRLCMTFEEGAMDEAGAGVVVDVMQGLTFGPGPVGAAVQLTAASAIHVAETPALDLTTAMTMEGFGFVAATPTSRAGFMDNNGQWGMWIGNNLRPYCTLTGSTVSGPTIALDTWTHIACVFDSTTFRIYVDGVLFGMVNRTAAASTAGLDGANIGQDCTPTGAGDPLTGGLDEVRIWASARTDEQIAAAAQREQ